MTDYRSPTEWPSTARAIADATERGIRAARVHDLEGFNEAIEQLEIRPEAREVHAHMMRELLETRYQDGLSGDDVAEVVTHTVGDAALWGAPVDPSAVALTLTGALGVGEQSDNHDAPTTTSPSALITGAAILVIADLAATTALDHEPYLVRAVEETRRAQTMEMP